MKVLHTADWHLGQRLAGRERTEEHREFFKWLLRTLRKEQVDLLIVAGDVFDSAHPPQATMQLYYDFLRDLSSLERCGAVVVGGNHDSPAHLNAPRQLLKRFQIHVIGCASENREDDIIQITPGFDLLDSICVCAVPYLRDRDVQQVVVGEAAGMRSERLRDGVYRYYEDIRKRAQAMRDRGLPLLVTGHLTIGDRSARAADDEEKDISIGTLAAVDESRLPQDFDYVALGHLHEPHSVGGRRWMRYSGSPFPMSFGEAGQQKEVVMLEFNEGQLQQCRTIVVPIPRPLHRFAGTLDDFTRWIDQLDSGTDTLTPWIEVHVSELEDATDLNEQVHQRVEGHAVEVLKVMSAAAKPEAKAWTSPSTSLQEYRPEQVFAERCESATLDEDAVAVCKDTFAELLALHEARKLEIVS